jgi:hypothetical protein
MNDSLPPLTQDEIDYLWFRLRMFREMLATMPSVIDCLRKDGRKPPELPPDTARLMYTLLARLGKLK